MCLFNESFNKFHNYWNENDPKQYSKKQFIFRKGSTIVEHEVITDKKDEAKQDIVAAVISLSKGEGNISYANELITPSSVSVIDATGEERGLH